jgi:hypothetical protein
VWLALIMARSLLPMRRLHLVDAKNLVGLAGPASEQVADCDRWCAGAFADPATDLALNGARVTVVANRASLSRRLRLTASEILIFDNDLPATSSALSPGESA